MKLYAELQGADSYDTEALCKKLKKTKANLAHEKEYLQEVLFRAMREHHSDDADIARANAFSDVLILFQKGCYEMAADMTEKAIKEAQRATDNHLLMKFLAMQRNVNGYMRQNGNEKYKLWDENIAATDELMAEQHVFWQLQKTTFRLTRMGGVSSQISSKRDSEELNSILRSEFIDCELVHPLHRAMQAGIRAKIYTRLGDREQALRCMLEDLKIHETHPIETGVDEKLYFVIVQNVVNTMIYCNKIDEAKELLARIKSRYYHKLPLDKTFLDRTFDAHHMDNMLQLHQIGYREGKYTKREVETLLVKFEKEIETIARDMMPQRRIMPYYFAAKLAFLIEDYSASLKWFDKVFTFSVKEGNGDPLTSSRMGAAVVHYQLGNYTLCKSLAASTTLFIKKIRRSDCIRKSITKISGA